MHRLTDISRYLLTSTSRSELVRCATDSLNVSLSMRLWWLNFVFICYAYIMCYPFGLGRQTNRQITWCVIQKIGNRMKSALPTFELVGTGPAVTSFSQKPTFHDCFLWDCGNLTSSWPIHAKVWLSRVKWRVKSREEFDLRDMWMSI